MADVVYFDSGIDLPFCPPTIRGLYISGSGCCSDFYTAFIGGNQTYNLTYTLPTSSGTSGQVLTNDGNGNLSWQTPSGGGGAGNPAGTDGMMQYNNGGSFGGTTLLYWDDLNNRLGFNTTSPQQSVDVRGTLRITGSFGTGTTLMGRNNDGDVSNISLGFGLSLSGGTLAVTGSTGGVTGNYVPYIGATGNTNLGGYGIAGSYFQLSTSTGGTLVPGMFSWNGTDGTADLMLKGGSVTLQIGQEQLVRVINETGANLLESEYKVVRVNGSTGTRLKVALALASGETTSAETIGIVTENINQSQEGFVTTSGLVKGINTTGSLQGETWADGDMIYLSPSTPGAITNIKPQAPNHIVILGYVVTAANNGSIYVKVNNGYELDELHNVAISGQANNDLLAYDSSLNLWKNRSFSSLSLTTGTGTTNYLPKWSSASGLTDSIIIQTGSNVDIRGTLRVTGSTGTATSIMGRDGNFDVSAITVGTGLSLSGNTLTATGTSGGGTLTGSGTATQVAFWGGVTGTTSTALTSSSGLTWDNALSSLSINSITIKQSSIEGPANVSFRLTGSSINTYVQLENTGTGTNGIVFRVNNSANSFKFLHANNYSFTLGYSSTNGAAWFGNSSSLVTVNASAQVQIDSTTKGFLPPRVTTTQKNNISTPAEGLTVYDSTIKDLSVYDGTAWTSVISGSGTATQVAFWSGATGTTSTALTSSTGLTWDNVNGRLGIGTSSPQAQLNVIGQGRFESNTSAAAIRVTTSFQINAIQQLSLRSLFFGSYSEVPNASIAIGATRWFTMIQSINSSTNVTTPLLFQPYGGNVLIGAFSSDNGQILQVSGSTLLRGSGSTSVGTTLLLENSGSTQLFRIDDGGGVKVGAGTNDSSAILQIDSTSRGFLPPRMSTTDKNGISTPAAGLVVYDSTLNNLNVYNGTAWTSTLTGSGTATQIAFWDGATGTTSTALTSSSRLTWNAATESLGVGTSNPIARLQIIGSGTGSTTNAFRIQNSGGTDLFRVDDAGSFYSGNLTYSSSGTLSLTNAIAIARVFNSVNIGSASAQADSNLKVTNSGGREPLIVAASNGTTRFLIVTKESNTGIGDITNVSSRLQVRGSGSTSTTTTFLLENSGSTQLFRVTDNGNVIVGTGTAAQTFHVAGTMRLTNSTATNAATIMGRDENGDVSAVTVGSGLSLSGNTLTATGTSGGGGTLTGSGTATQVAFWDGSTSLTGSTNLTYDSVGLRLILATNTIIEPNNSNAGLKFKGSGNRSYDFGNVENYTGVIGIHNFITITKGSAPTSGSGVCNFITISSVINQTGGASGTTRGLLISPTLTSAFDWRSIEWTNNTGWGLYGAGTANNYLGGALAIGTTTVNTSAILQADSTTRGFLPPRMSTTNKTSISNPTQGLVVYDTTMQALSVYNGTNWATAGGGEQMFTVSATTATVNFNSGNIADITLASSTTLTLTGGTFGTFILKLTQDAVGGRTVSWPSTVRWSGGIPPTLTTSPSKTDIISFIFDGSLYYGTYALNF